LNYFRDFSTLLIPTTLEVDEGKDLGKGVFAGAGNVSVGIGTLEGLAYKIMLVKNIFKIQFQNLLYVT
jgi:hypothetical protein